MSDQSIFADKNKQPGEQDLSIALGKAYTHWKSIKKQVLESIPGVKEEWNFSRQGWNCRLKGKKSVIVYLMPLATGFKASFVFGAKATEAAMKADISEATKQVINEAKVYAEGRGFRIEVKNANVASDVKKLVEIKVAGQ
jgi:hypothetical protein